MSHTNETCDDILRDMFQDHSTDNAAYRIRCYANRWQRALRRERARSAVHAPTRPATRDSSPQKCQNGPLGVYPLS